MIILYLNDFFLLFFVETIFIVHFLFQNFVNFVIYYQRHYYYYCYCHVEEKGPARMLMDGTYIVDFDLSSHWLQPLADSILVWHSYI